MAETEQAAAGAEAAEPGGPGSWRSFAPNPRRLLAYLPPLPDALRELPRRVRTDLAGHGADYLAGARSGLAVAGAGWLVAAALTLALWALAAPAGADPWIAVRVSGQLWLASHHVLMHSPDGPFGLSPLGFTLLPLLGLFAGGRRIAKRTPDYLPRATVGAALGYAVAACVIATASADSGLHPNYVQVLIYPAMIALVGHGAGAADALRRLLPGAAARRWPPHAARGALAALAVWIGAAAFVAAGALIVHADALAGVERGIGGGAVGESGLFLVDLALVPNAVLWAGAVLLGPGFALGTGTSVTVFGVVRGPLPGLPMLAAAPQSQDPTLWWLLLLAVPLAAGAVGTSVIARAVRPWSQRLGSAAAMAGLCGLAVGVLEMYAGGPVAFGPMSVVGSTAWLAGALAALEFGLAAAAVLGVWYALPVSVTAWRGRTERILAAEPELPETLEPEPSVIAEPEPEFELLEPEPPVIPEPEPEPEPVLEDAPVVHLVPQRQDEPEIEPVVAPAEESVAEPEAPVVELDDAPVSPAEEVTVDAATIVAEPDAEPADPADLTGDQA